MPTVAPRSTRQQRSMTRRSSSFWSRREPVPVSKKTRVPKVPEVPGVRTVGAFLCLFLFTAGAPYAFAQQPPDGLNDQQRLGRQVFAQSCGVCHLPPARGARTYGPVLGRTSGGGNDDLVRKVILEGTPRMPGFKYMLQPAQRSEEH